MLRLRGERIFVTGIGTGVGKTVVAAIVTEALRADYWKPVQCGDLDHTDSDRVRALISNPESRVLPEAFRLAMPASPHTAADAEGISIAMEDFRPVVAGERSLVIEGAGGILVPLAEGLLFADLVKRWRAKAIVVSRTYLGSINHTLLTLEALRARGIEIAGVIFNGEENASGEGYIIRHSGARLLGRIRDDLPLDKDLIAGHAAALGPSIMEALRGHEVSTV